MRVAISSRIYSLLSVPIQTLFAKELANANCRLMPVTVITSIDDCYPHLLIFGTLAGLFWAAVIFRLVVFCFWITQCNPAQIVPSVTAVTLKKMEK